MRIVAIGNCHIGGISSCIRVSTGVEVKAIQLRPSELWWETCLSDLEQADMIAVMSTFESQVKTRIGRLIEKIKPIPHILTHRFHPDLIYINTPTGLLQSVMHVNHSAIVAYCYLNNVSESEVPYWFNESNFKALGYLNKTIENDPWLAKQEELTKYPVKDMTSVWARRKAFVHTPNHPIMEVFQDIALHFAKINSIPVIFGDPSSQVVDRGARHSIWPVYPEIASVFSIDGGYYFKVPETEYVKRGKTAYAISLDEFIHESYLTYREYCRENGDACIRSAIPKFFKDFCPKNHFRGTRVVSDNPYIGLNDRSYWSRSISRVDASDVDPVGIPKFRISSYDKIGSAGSCFAQHISNAVASAGYNYFVTETGKDRCGVVDRSLQYGVYSARYGNIYTAKQLLQLFDRSFGHFSPIDQYWETRKGRFVDPFRATVEPGGFPCVRELLEDRERHFECTRRLFKELDVFVFTLGLTECWVSAIDGAVYSVAPGVEAGSFSHNDHQFLNLGFEEILSDLIAFRERLKSVNPRAKLLLTVSPVALVATYSQNHVLVANTYSKSVLRSVASVFAESYPDVDYFPSYEIVLGQHNDGKYLDKDRRRIREEGVMRVFDLLLKHYFVDSKNDLKDSVSMAEIVCDEELLDNDR